MKKYIDIFPHLEMQWVSRKCVICGRNILTISIIQYLMVVKIISRAGSINAPNKSVDSLMLQEVIESTQNQKKGKSSGLNGLLMESFIYGGLKLYIYLSLLFTSFVRRCYLPKSVMETVIKPMVKNEGGDLTDVNNYRAIALSSVETKTFEAIILCKVRVDSDYDAPQFGFKTSHSTGLCTVTVKKTIEYYVNGGSHVFTCFIDFT